MFYSFQSMKKLPNLHLQFGTSALTLVLCWEKLCVTLGWKGYGHNSFS